MIRRSRFVVALALTLALGVASLAVADGVSENTPFVDGNVNPTKLDKKKYKPVEMLLGVRTEANVDGNQKNPSAEKISVGKNIKFDLGDIPTCSTLPPSGSTTEQAKAACPEDSYIGGGEANVQFPGLPLITDVVVSVFHGPQQNGIQLHTASPTLGQAAPTVLGQVVKSDAGSQYSDMLEVPHAPETGSGMITKFNATIDKSSKAVVARCKSKKHLFLRQVTYSDGTSETASLEDPCKQKKKKGGN